MAALRCSVAVLSAGALAYEVLLVRLLSVVQWQLLASTVISLALLGYGASGTFLALLRARLERRFADHLAVLGALFSVAAVVCFALAQRISFQGSEALWEPSRLWRFGLLYVVLAVPFFLAATAIGLALLHAERSLSDLYRWDLMGAGVGALSVVGVMALLSLERALVVVASCGLLSSAAALVHGRRAGVAVAPVLGAALLAAAFPTAWLDLQLSSYKGLSLALRVPNASIVTQRSGPQALLSVVDSPDVPLRFAPGLSLQSAHQPSRQLALFVDGDDMEALDRASPGELGYLDDLPQALPYSIVDRPRAAVIGAGGGRDVLLALRKHASHVDLIDADPVRLQLVEQHLRRQLSSSLETRVEAHVGEARGLLAARARAYDLIVVSHLSSGAGGGVALASSELTVEGLSTYWRALEPTGVVAVSRWLDAPPRGSLKLIATAITALERAGIADPRRHLVVVRSWNVVVVMIKRHAFEASEIERVQAFSRERSFDLSYFPGITEQEVNRYHHLEGAPLWSACVQLLGQEREQFFARYKFFIEPATDDRPYFHHFFRWRTLGELLELRQRGGAGLIEVGYLLLIVALAQAAVVGLLLIVVPMLLWRGRSFPARGAASGYFVMLGLAFLLIEVGLMHRLTIYLSSPVYAVSVTLAGFLVFAGLGSGASPGLEARLSRWSAVETAIAVLVVLGLAHLALVPSLLDRTLAWPLAAKLVLALATIAPIAFFMGMPFPLGLRRVGELEGSWLPWAWGLNGWASVLSAVLATLLSIHLGFTGVVLVALALYVGAAWSFRRLNQAHGRARRGASRRLAGSVIG